uniref:Uncharacterized protein n=1 Tax=Ixodes ricinus TaxID=34613 RepID=A0A6B0UUJ1_IXORI
MARSWMHRRAARSRAALSRPSSLAEWRCCWCVVATPRCCRRSFPYLLFCSASCVVRRIAQPQTEVVDHSYRSRAFVGLASVAVDIVVTVVFCDASGPHQPSSTTKSPTSRYFGQINPKRGTRCAPCHTAKSGIYPKGLRLIKEGK